LITAILALNLDEECRFENITLIKNTYDIIRIGFWKIFRRRILDAEEFIKLLADALKNEETVHISLMYRLGHPEVIIHTLGSTKTIILRPKKVVITKKIEAKSRHKNSRA